MRQAAEGHGTGKLAAATGGLSPGGSDDWFAAVFSSTTDALALLDAESRVYRTNPVFEKLLGRTDGDLAGRMIDEILPDPGKTAFWTDVRQSLAAGRNTFHQNIQCLVGGSELLRLQLDLRCVGDRDGRGRCSLLRVNLLERQENGALESKQPGHDFLTGLPDRRLFQDRLQQALRSARREGNSFALLLLGLDRFSLINNGLGYSSGDRLLCEIASRMADCVRASDTVARIEGDRFALITPITADDHSVIVAHKVLRSVQVPATVGGQEVSISGSIGITIAPMDGEDVSALLGQAEQAMRFAKENGGNCSMFFANEMNSRARSRLTLESGLRRALQQGEFVLFYQPKVDVDTSRIVGAESLIRWRDPEKGMIPPVQFIPVAEETGIIVEIGAWVVREACRQNSEWQGRGLKVVPISVNVSPRQFRAAGLVDHVKTALADSILAAGLLELEITESMFMGDIKRTLAILHELRALGIGLSIDDFGTGYSNLNYLTQFPITTLKIDRSFIKGMEADPSRAEVTRAIIGLSHSLNLTIVAEGVESREHLAFLRQHGCNTVQGFYYSQPVGAAEFATLLERGFIRPE